MSAFPVIDLQATGANILRLRQARGYSVRDLQQYFGFEEPQAIYKWQRGQSLPTVDNLYALSVLLDVSMNEILITKNEQQAEACCSVIFRMLGMARMPGAVGMAGVQGRQALIRPAGAHPAPGDAGPRRTGRLVCNERSSLPQGEKRKSGAAGRVSRKSG